jgi:hypothetical protein
MSARPGVIFPEAKVGARVRILPEGLRGKDLPQGGELGMITCRDSRKDEWIVLHGMNGKKSVERRYGPGEFEVLRWQIVKARDNGQAKPVAGVEPAGSEQEAVEKVALLQLRSPRNHYEFRVERIRAGGPQTEKGEKEATPVLNGNASPALLVADSPTRKMFSALETAYAHFNERLFERQLPAALLNLSRSAGSSKNSVTLGFFEPEAWRGDAGNICELSMTPVSTARGPEDYYATLVHEMAHFLDHVRGVKPKSPGYHGKPWWATMERIGLPPVPGGKNGTSKISVHHAIQKDGPYALAFKDLSEEALLPFVSTESGLWVAGQPEAGGEEGEGEGETKQGKRARYECGGCKTTMRGPSGRKLICGSCEVAYQETGF